ncbi:MAG: biopolymer transporter ExbD [Planctomycetota bacterium]|nr:biopolymer transporter ExbD [Planctomycetota bacterium]
MRLQKKPGGTFAEGDMTPMIDMTFQLIAFFMVLINFTEADQNERIHLPMSELAKPADAPFESPLTLQLTKESTILFNGQEFSTAQLQPELRREKSILKKMGRDPLKATIIIRADAAAETGVVQALIKLSQEAGFEKFALRAKQAVANAPTEAPE